MSPQSENQTPSQVEEEGEVQMALSYILPGASWTASYEARVGSNEQKLALSYAVRPP